MRASIAVGFFGVLQVFSGVLRKAAEVVRGSNKPMTAAGFLKPIDTQSISRELELVRVGGERGTAGLPPTEANSLDGTEQQIVQTVTSEWSWQGGELINNLRAYAQRLTGYSIQAEFTKLQIAAKDTLANLRAAHHRAEAELGPLRENFLGHRNSLRDFKNRHKLSTPARALSYRWTTLGLLSIFIAIESVLNGLFFAKGSEFGLIGGIGIAIGISLFNVIFAYALGSGPARFINYRNFFIKSIALIVTIFGAACLLALHAFAAHYRDAVALVGDDRAMGEAAKTLMATAWQLADINSYYLFGLGLLFAASAFAKGYTSDDRYPFYGAKSRAMNSAREDYSEVHSDLFDDLEAIKENTLRDLNDGITRIPLFPQQAANIRAQRSALVQTFRGYESSIVVAANQLLSQYRDANRKNRKMASPSHFDENWQLPHSFLDTAEVRTLTADADRDEVDTNTALQELKQLSQAILDEYEILLSAYPHPTKMDEAYAASS